MNPSHRVLMEWLNYHLKLEYVDQSLLSTAQRMS